jgi:predicted membrane protein
MSSHVEKRVLAGIVLLAAGIVLLLKYYNIFPFQLPYYLFSWKTLLIVLGLVFLITDRNKSTGFILLFIGSVFLAGDVFDMSLRDVFRLAIPVALIIAGSFLVFRRQSFSVKEINTREGDDIKDFLNDVSIFGGSEKKIKTQNFKGGNLTAIFGGSDIDLRAADLAPGVNAVDMFCLFGGVTFRVPESWEVKNEVSAIFGGFSDKRLQDKVNMDQGKPGKVLYLKGLVLFGGGEIK